MAATVEMKAQRSKSRNVLWLLALAAVFVCGALAVFVFRFGGELHPPKNVAPAFQIGDAIELASLPTVTRFDFPLGTEDGGFAYNAQRFTENRHLGDDLNGIGGENSDLGDPVYAVADGRVIFAGEGGPGWGNVVIVLHAYDDGGARRFVQSYYAHVQRLGVRVSEDVRRGQQIATVGTAGGRYLAHLHFEMREFTTTFIGPGYREDTRGWLDPSAFIAAHRGTPPQ